MLKINTPAAVTITSGDNTVTVVICLSTSRERRRHRPTSSQSAAGALLRYVTPPLRPGGAEFVRPTIAVIETDDDFSEGPFRRLAGDSGGAQRHPRGTALWRTMKRRRTTVDGRYVFTARRLRNRASLR